MLNLTITVPVCLKSIGDPQKHLKPTLLTQLAIMPIQSHRTEKKTNYISLISHMVLLDNNEIESQWILLPKSPASQSLLR